MFCFERQKCTEMFLEENLLLYESKNYTRTLSAGLPHVSVSRDDRVAVRGQPGGGLDVRHLTAGQHSKLSSEYLLSF